jgi:hypothetical protein
VIRALLLYLWAHELAIICHDYRSVEYFRGLSQSQIIGYSAAIPKVFLLLHTDDREQESFPCHLQTQGSHVPMAGDYFYLSDLKVASLVQVSR